LGKRQHRFGSGGIDGALDAKGIPRIGFGSGARKWISCSAEQQRSASGDAYRTWSIKITDLKCAVIGRNPGIRIVTDQGVSGYGQAESSKAYLKPMVLFYKDYLLGEDPTDVNRVMMKIRRMGASKPWGSAVSAIEIALWDIAGQVAGVPVYKLLGGKIRNRVRAYNGGVRFPMTGQTPRDDAENMARMKEAKEGFTLIKQAVGFHNPAMMRANRWADRAGGARASGCGAPAELYRLRVSRRPAGMVV
jgi:L-alanine-DL-glutamate epimerase-like enolase superfamily enzyme